MVGSMYVRNASLAEENNLRKCSNSRKKIKRTSINEVSNKCFLFYFHDYIFFFNLDEPDCKY